MGILTPVDNNNLKSEEEVADNIKVKVIKKKKNRCNHDDCKKKLGFDPIICKCGGMYCGNHRYPHVHDCTFDHKGHNKELLEKNMVKLTKSKLIKI